MLAVLAACSDDTRVVFSQVTWMEWPATVPPAQPFSVRLVGFNAGGCGDARFDAGVREDNSAVTFEPFFVFSGPPLNCPAPNAAAVPSVAFYDLRSQVRGLTPSSPRSYEIRGAADAAVPVTATSSFPVRTFGEIVVRSDSADTSRANAGGNVSAARDSAGCVRMLAGFVRYVIENPPADTATFWSAFVQGYVYRPAVSVCGDSVVFHLVSKN